MLSPSLSFEIRQRGAASGDELWLHLGAHILLDILLGLRTHIT
jgi:hypothetical protein